MIIIIIIMIEYEVLSINIPAPVWAPWGGLGDLAAVAVVAAVAVAVVESVISSAVVLLLSLSYYCY